MKALIASPDMEARSRLKQALHHEEKSGLLRFQTIYAVPSLTAALHALQADSSFDLILISDTFGKESIDRFIVDARQTRADQYAFIVVLKPLYQDYEGVMGNIASGVHGLLCEPYSIDNLREIAEISQKVREANAERRALCGLPLLVDLMLKQIETKVKKMRDGKGVKVPLNKKYRQILEKICNDFPQSAPPLYFEALEKALEKATPRLVPIYEGASETLRRKYGAKQQTNEQVKHGIFSSRRVVKG